MKKFNPDKELGRIQNRNDMFSSNKQAKRLFAPLFVMACCGISMIAIAFSANLSTGSIKTHTVKIDIINGMQDTIINTIKEGPYKEVIQTDATFGGLNCTKGELYYEEETNTIYSENLNTDTYCILTFLDDGTKKVATNELYRVADNFGTSYYFKGDSENNYVLYKGILFRIVRINGDGTYRLITDQSIGEYSFGANDYQVSNIPEILNSWLTFETIERDYDIANYELLSNETLINLMGYQTLSVGLLSINEAKLINDGAGNSYLGNNVYLANGFGENRVWAIEDGEITTVEGETFLNIHPVINVQIKNINGQGTQTNPYVIED